VDAAGLARLNIFRRAAPAWPALTDARPGHGLPQQALSVTIDASTAFRTNP
jgi:hypothetical protein